MPIQIVNNGAAIKITTNGAVRRILKSQVWEISVIKTNVIKLDLGLGALHNIYINFADVDSPVTASPDALCDSINNMMQSLVSGGATEQNQLSEITQLQSISSGIATLNNTISSGGSGSGAFAEALIVDESNPNIIYRGYAAPGANVGAAVWAIKKTVSNTTGDLTTTTWADGNQNFDNIWNNRATLVYS